MDKYLGVRYPVRATLLDHLEDPLLFLEEPASIREADRATAYRRGEELAALMADGALCAGLDDLYAAPGWLWAQTGRCRTLLAENFARSLPDQPLKALVNVPCHSLPAWGGEVSALLDDLQPLCAKGTAVTVLAGTPRAAAALRATCAPGGWLSPPTRPPRRSRGLCRCCPAAFRPGAGCRLRAMR